MKHLSLFERIGGEPAIDAAVDVFYCRVMGDARIAHHFAGLDMNRQYRKQKTFLTFAFGGDVQPTPLLNLRTAHAHLKLTESDFDVVIDHLRATLVALSVPAELVDEAADLAQSVRSEVLNR